MSLKVKRILALCVCFALLAVAVYQNIRHDVKESNSETDEPSDEVIYVQDNNSENVDNVTGDGVPTGIKCDNPTDYIAGLRIEREAERSAFTEECLAVIDDTDSSETEVLNAQDEIIAVSAMTECEDLIESSIKSRGYEDVFVGFGDDGFVDVVLIAETVTASEIETISSVVFSQIEIEPEFLTVSSVY